MFLLFVIKVKQLIEYKLGENLKKIQKGSSSPQKNNKECLN